jgi:hypothetical protein
MVGIDLNIFFKMAACSVFLVFWFYFYVIVVGTLNRKSSSGQAKLFVFNLNFFLIFSMFWSIFYVLWKLNHLLFISWMSIKINSIKSNFSIWIKDSLSVKMVLSVHRLFSLLLLFTILFDTIVNYHWHLFGKTKTKKNIIL